MLYHLLYPLASEFGGFNVVRYITFRTGAATLTALFVAFVVERCEAHGSSIW